MRLGPRIVAAACIAALVAAPACSKGSSGGATTTSGPPTSAPTSSTTGAVPTASTAAQESTTTTAFTSAKASDRVSLELIDYSFVGMPATVTGPRVFFTAVNRGPSDHEIVIVDGDGHRVASAAAVPKGGHIQVAAELQPGTYTIECLLKRDGQTHAQMGMQNAFAVN